MIKNTLVQSPKSCCNNFAEDSEDKSIEKGEDANGKVWANGFRFGKTSHHYEKGKQANDNTQRIETLDVKRRVFTRLWISPSEAASRLL